MSQWYSKSKSHLSEQTKFIFLSAFVFITHLDLQKFRSKADSLIEVLEYLLLSKSCSILHHNSSGFFLLFFTEFFLFWLLLPLRLGIFNLRAGGRRRNLRFEWTSHTEKLICRRFKLMTPDLLNRTNWASWTRLHCTMVTFLLMQNFALCEVIILLQLDCCLVIMTLAFILTRIVFFILKLFTDGVCDESLIQEDAPPVVIVEQLHVYPPDSSLSC